MAEQQRALSEPSPAQRQAATQLFERARQVLTTGNYDYVMSLLQDCCKIDPGNLMYRQVLRGTEKKKYGNNLRGAPLAGLRTFMPRMRLNGARRKQDYRKVLEYGEAILAINPWDTAVQLEMARAADQIGLLDVAVFILEQARQKNPNAPKVNKPLAQLYEKQGNYPAAIALWDLVAKHDLKDLEARSRGKDLAATRTIETGGYEDKALGGEEQRAAFRTKAAGPKGSSAKPLSAGTLSIADQQLERQAEPLQAKIDADPANVHAYLQLIALYQKAAKWDLAREVCKRGLDATGQHFDLHVANAELDVAVLKHNLLLAEQRLRANPGDDKARQVHARLPKEIAARELEIYRKRAERYPNETGHRLELGVRLIRIGQVDEAIQELQVARKDPRNRWKALLYLGQGFQAKNNWALAKRNYEEALQALPAGEEDTRKDVLFRLAKGSAEHGDLRTAVELGGELANLDYTFQDIGKLLEEWQDKVSKV